MNFAIEFEGEPWTDEDGRWQSVKFTLGDSVEGDAADLTHWEPLDYEAQWHKELTALLGPRGSGALITSIHDPRYGGRVWTWTMWRKDHEVCFQNRILFMLEDCPDFNPDNVAEHIGAHNSRTEDGQQVSEWTVPVSAITKFLAETS